MSERHFHDRVAVITGAGRGLGRAHALLLASKGAKVVVNDLGSSLQGEGHDLSVAQSVVAEIVAAGGEAIANSDSVGTFEGGTSIINTAIDAFGKIDILVHNAGNSRLGTLDVLAPADFMSVVDVHLVGAFNVVRAAFPYMRDAGYGRVVLTGSIGGIYSTHGLAGYAVSKSGMIGLNNVVAIEGASCGIKSNVLLPGAITRMAERMDLEQYPLTGPETVAPVMGYLAHEDCAVSGELLMSMAGRVARIMFAETPGIHRPDWTIDDVARHIDAIRDSEKLWLLHPADNGYEEHQQRTFDMARQASFVSKS